MTCFLYGAGKQFVDVTAHVIRNCRYGDRIYIPAGDTGDAFFPDPLPGFAKQVMVIYEQDGVLQGSVFGPNERIWLSLPEGEYPPEDGGGRSRRIVVPPPAMDTAAKVDFLRAQLEFTGDLRFEWVEQHNSVDFIEPTAKVLELGSGPGRNTLIMSCILNDETNLVTLECNPETLEILKKNRAANDFRFHIEPAALSYRKLMFNRTLTDNPDALRTLPGDELLDGYEWINTVTFEQITEKYGIRFDTLVADCEGALYYILRDNDRILENIRTITLESDYPDAEHKWFVERVFAKYGFRKVKHWSMSPPNPDLPRECTDSFWEVWRR